MDGLPWHLLNEILFRLDLESLAMMRCTNRSFLSHISDDPYFKSEYFYRLGSGLLHISTYGSSLLCNHSLGDSRSPRTKDNLMVSRILGSCSGLLLLSINSLCIANPLTKKFLFLDHPRSRKFHSRLKVCLGDRMYIGFAVDHIDRNTQSFKIVCMTELRKYNETMYEFEITAGGSWRFSKTKITCNTSDLDNRMRKPVYLDGSLHWLRNDGSIVAFNPETEQAKVISTKFPQELSWKTLFAADDNSLTLISATEEVIYIYALDNILTDPKWVLVRRIRYGVLDEKKLIHWNVEAYDGKCLVLREEIRKDHCCNRVVHGYDLRANKWGLMGSIPGRCDAALDYCLFTPSPSSVIGLDEKKEEMISACDDQRISTLRSIMGLVSDGMSSGKLEKQFRKRSVEEDNKKPILLEKMVKPPSKFSDLENANNKRRRED